MIRCRYLLVAALLTSTSAFAAGNVTLTDQNNQYFGTQQNPLWVTGISGGNGGGNYTGATATAPGTNGTTATPIQGVDGGKAVAVTWSNQTVSVTGSVSVSNFPTTQAVSGTVTANQGAAGTIAWKVDGSGVTQPVSAAALPLPAGASTSANQTNVQSAPGTSAGSAVTIQGATNSVPIPTAPTNAATVATAANQNSTAAGTSATNAQAVQGVAGGVALPVSGMISNQPTTGATLTTSQPSVTTTAAALAFSGTAHREVYNPASSTASIFIGASGVTTTTGWEIPPGASSGDLSRFSGSVFAVAPSSVTVRLISY